MDQKSGKPSQKRRAILQGSLAAPVVLTVSSASATTQTTLGRCLAKLEEGPKPAYLVDEIKPDDTWMRIQVPVVRLEEPNGTLIEEFAFYDRKLLGFRKVPSPHNVVVLPNGVNQHNLRTIDKGNRWGLQWVNETTKAESSLIQIEPPSGFRPVTGTCWTSFKNSK